MSAEKPPSDHKQEGAAESTPEINEAVPTPETPSQAQTFKEAGKAAERIISSPEDQVKLEAIKESLGINSRQESALKPEDKDKIEALKEPIQEIITQLLPEIKAGKYDLLIGDDTSGRIPTLIMRDVISEINLAYGREKIATYFIAGPRSNGTHDNLTKIQPLVEERLLQLKKSRGEAKEDSSSALLITDVIHSGKTVRSFVEAAKNAQMKMDVATISSLEKINLEDLVSEGAKIVTGVDSDGHGYIPPIFKQHHISGVIKDPEEVVSRPFKETTENPEEVQSTINESRKVAKRISEEILKEIAKEGGPTKAKNLSPEQAKENLRKAIDKLSNSSIETSESAEGSAESPKNNSEKPRERPKSKEKGPESTHEDKHGKGKGAEGGHGGHGKEHGHEAFKPYGVRDWATAGGAVALMAVGGGLYEGLIAPSIINFLGLKTAVISSLNMVGIGAGFFGIGSAIGLYLLWNFGKELWAERNNILKDIPFVGGLAGGGGGGGKKAAPKKASGGGGH